MEIIIISISAFLVSILTFFSGFGIGTILTPIFLIFFPVDVSIALTGIVHFLNNLFKLILVGKNADWKVVLRFGIPAVLAAFMGSLLLINIIELAPLFSYQFAGRTFEVYPVKLVIAVLLITFAILDLIPFLNKMQFGRDKLILGGILSGFFGGLSGHQGALRSAFLIKAGLTKEAFIATGVVVSSFIDFTRLTVYTTKFAQSGLGENIWLIVIATLSAFAGAFLGNKLLKKVTLKFIQIVVAVMLILIAVALGMGLI